MDFNEKAAARSKFRSSQHLKRVHGGRGRGRGQHAAPFTQGPELESNYDRYEVSDEEETVEGEVVRQSEGADLEQLLAESEQFYAQAHFRYRSFIETVDTEPPPVDVSAVEKELALEPELLMQALAQLPLSELLGIEQQFLVGLEHAVEAPTQVAPSQQEALAQQHQQQQQQQQQQQSQPSVQGQKQQQVQVDVHLQKPPYHSSSSSSGTMILPPAEGALRDAAACAAVSADDDDILQQLLEGSSSTADKQGGRPSSMQASVFPLQHRQPPPDSRSLEMHTGRAAPTIAPAAVGTAPANGAAASAGRAAAAAAAARGNDGDALDELLGLSGTAAHFQPQQVLHQQGSSSHSTARHRGSKPKSLEDWLDGF